MKVLVTGADGFVGRWCCTALVEAGHEVLAGVRSHNAATPLHGTQVIPFELDDEASIATAVATRPDAVLHLAAMASGARARATPLAAWQTNTIGTVRLCGALERAGQRPRFVLASTGEVYGLGQGRPALESDAAEPVSPYAASKFAAEIAVREHATRCEWPWIIARCFAQAGPGQLPDYFVPSMARRMIAATAQGLEEVKVGNLSPVREFLDVRDVANALVLLTTGSAENGVYNVARGAGVPLAELVSILGRLAGWHGRLTVDAALLRRADIEYLVGNGERLAALGWSAAYPLEQTLEAVVHEARLHPES